VSRATIPGNLLTEGVFSVHPCMRIVTPSQEEFSVRATVSFQVIDTYGPDAARGDWPGNISGVIRPKLAWTTEYRPSDTGAAPGD
jgi:lipopolysaccharide transport system ATP-binding protein